MKVSSNNNSAIIIPDVPIFVLNWDAGDMYIYALESCLKFLGEKCESWWLAGLSGDAFKFVYDRDDVREPMRDRVPVDIVGLASSSIGWEGKWYFNERLDKVISYIKGSLEQGYPVLTSNLGAQWYHGANIITGINEDTNEFLLQIGREDITGSFDYERIPIPEEWDGPVPGSIIWATNPIFILEKKIAAPNEEKTISMSINRAVEIYNKKSLPYKFHPGAQKYSTVSLKDKFVRQSLNAFEELSEEVKNTEVNWTTIWSITTQIGQLSYDRLNASKFLNYIANKFTDYSRLVEISNLYKQTVDNANLLKQSYWDNRLDGINDFKKILEEIRKSKSFVYSISNLKLELKNQLQKDFPIIDTLWGPAIIIDLPNRRNYNSKLTNSIYKNEINCFNLLNRFLK